MNWLPLLFLLVAPAAIAVPPALTSGEAVQRLSDGSLFVPKSAQRLLGLRTALAERGEFAPVIELPGTLIADPGTGGRVQAAQAGTVLPPPGGLAHIGQRVRKGEVLALLAPALDAGERAQAQEALATLDAQHGALAARVDRLHQLEGSVARKDIEAADAELAAQEARRFAARAALAGSVPLRAPASGVIAASHVVAGQVVDARDMLFEIVDPQRLAVEALAFDPAQVRRLGKASARLGDATLVLTPIGAAQALRAQALPVLFRVQPPASGLPLALGQTLTVFVTSGDPAAGVAVPRAAVQRTAGNESLVWVQEAPERFVARVVRTQPLDAERVRVLDGLKGGERVATQGSTALSQAR